MDDESDGRTDSSVSPHGADAAVADAVIPRFDDPAVDGAVVPSFDEPAELIQEDRAEDIEKVLPRFEPPGAHAPWESRPSPHDPALEPSFGLEGPEYDEEMPLADHIEEMIKRLAVVVVIAGSVSLIVWPFTPDIIDFLWYSMLPSGETAQPRIYEPLEFLLTRIKVASLLGLVVALPVVVYETYAFMRPGLYRHERRYYLAAIPTSLVLAVVGVLFAYFIVLPALFTYFLTYSQEAGAIAFALGRTFDLILILMGYLAIVFQIPLFIMLAIMMGLTSRRWLAEKRLYFWGAFLGISFIASPDTTGMAPIIIALTMVALFEGTLSLLRWVGR